LPSHSIDTKQFVRTNDVSHPDTSTGCGAIGGRGVSPAREEIDIMPDRDKVLLTEAEKDAEIIRLKRIIERQTKRAQRARGRLSTTVRPVLGDGSSTEKLDLKQLTDLQIRHAVEAGNTPALIAVFKELRESPANVLSEQDQRDLTYMRSLRSMTADQLRARIAERQASLQQADAGYYQLPPTVHGVEMPEAEMNDEEFTARMLAYLVEEIQSGNQAIITAVRHALAAAPEPLEIASGANLSDVAAAGGGKGRPIDLTTLLPPVPLVADRPIGEPVVARPEPVAFKPERVWPTPARGVVAYPPPVQVTDILL
jgi:hypothetical protein